MPKMNPRQLATTLAALRYWQESHPDTTVIEKRFWEFHFADDSPLSNDEIDELCEALNFDDNDLFGFTRDDLKQRAESVANDDECEALTEDEIEEAWEIASNKEWIQDVVSRQVYEVMDDTIREVVAERDQPGGANE